MEAKFGVSVPDPVLVPFYYSVSMRFGMVQDSVPGVSMVRDTILVWYQNGTMWGNTVGHAWKNGS